MLGKSRGIVAFAVNTDTTDYVGIAHKTMSLASRKLGIPYTLITEQSISKHIRFSYRNDIDTGQFVEWKNMGRHRAYDLTPYDETLVLDIDYIVQDDSILKYFDVDFDYLLTRSARLLDGSPTPTLMGTNSLPMVWATVFMFRKTERSRMFFAMVDRIQENYHYYRDLFNVQSRTYRNDYAFAMADVIINGFYIDHKSLPALLNIMQPIDSLRAENGKIIVRDKQRAYILPQINLHVLAKKYFETQDFDIFVEAADE